MDFSLTPEELRVLGALVEKSIATPDNYPLSLNALVNACNQLTARDPVVSYDENHRHPRPRRPPRKTPRHTLSRRRLPRRPLQAHAPRPLRPHSRRNRHPLRPDAPRPPNRRRTPHPHRASLSFRYTRRNRANPRVAHHLHPRAARHEAPPPTGHQGIPLRPTPLPAAAARSGTRERFAPTR